MTRATVGRSAGARAGRCVGAAVALVLLWGATLAGCTAARNSLGTNASPCFDSLALAEDAVHDHGTFAGVRQLSLTAFSADVHLQAVLAPYTRTVHDVCVVSYRGYFRADQVDRPLGPPPPGGVGHFAIVIVAKPQNSLVGTVVTATEPLRFGHPI
jgi:hypothetical protein